MRTRPLTLRREPISHAVALELRPRFRTVLVPDPAGTPVEIQIDRVIEPEDGEALLIVATRALLRLGVFPLLPVEVRLPGDPVRPLTLLVAPPRSELTIDPTLSVARVLIVTGGAPLSLDPDLYDDAQVPARAFGLNIGASDADASVETVVATPEPDPRG